jgi:adenylate cyclase
MHIILHMQIGGTEKRGKNMGGLEATLLQAYAGRQRAGTVLVAAMRAREGQRPAAEPATAHAIARCLEALDELARSSGGRVVRRRAAELMAVFPTPDAAAAAATRMHAQARRLDQGGELTLRSAFHSGPVRQRGHDVYGETVNLAAELASRAGEGQILVSAETAARLTAELQPALRGLPCHARAIGTSELDWHVVPLERLGAVAPPPELQLTYRYQTLLRRREGDAITIGRDADCDLCVDMRVASRRHCTVERRREHFVLRDHSTNGTFVTLEGDRELRIRAEELVLRGRGWLSFGASRLLAEELVQFACK